MYYKFKAYKNNIENEKYSIDVFDRFTVTSCYDDNAIKNETEYKY